MHDFVLFGVFGGIAEKGMNGGWPRETLAIPRNLLDTPVQTTCRWPHEATDPRPQRMSPVAVA